LMDFTYSLISDSIAFASNFVENSILDFDTDVAL